MLDRCCRGLLEEPEAVSASARPLGRAAFLEAELRQALAEPSLELRQAEPVGGGCIHHALRLSHHEGDCVRQVERRLPRRISS